MRRRYDPRELAKALEERNAAAQAAAANFGAALASGGFDPAAAGFNQGEGCSTAQGAGPAAEGAHAQ